MIPIIRLHYKIDQKLNKLASNSHQSISVEDKDFVLNEECIRLIKMKIGHNNIYKVGFDGFRKRYQDLENFVVPYEEIQAVQDSGAYKSYSFQTDQLNHPLLVPIDTYTTCSRDKCHDRIVVVEQIVKHSDVSLLLKSVDYRPSFAYQSTFAVISSGMFIIYVQDPDGDFKVDKAYISYLRYPKKMCLGGYEDFDGKLLSAEDCELPEHLEDELLDMVVRNLAMVTENTNSVNSFSSRIKENE